MQLSSRDLVIMYEALQSISSLKHRAEHTRACAHTQIQAHTQLFQFSFSFSVCCKIDVVETTKTKASEKAHTCNLSSGEVETEGLAVQGQPGLYEEEKEKANPCENAIQSIQSLSVCMLLGSQFPAYFPLNCCAIAIKQAFIPRALTTTIRLCVESQYRFNVPQLIQLGTQAFRVSEIFRFENILEFYIRVAQLVYISLTTGAE